IAYSGHTYSVPDMIVRIDRVISRNHYPVNFGLGFHITSLLLSHFRRSNSVNFILFYDGNAVFDRTWECSCCKYLVTCLLSCAYVTTAPIIPTGVSPNHGLFVDMLAE